MNFIEDSDVPVLLIIFNRQNETSKVFEQIRKAAPKKLFIAADGPRLSHPNDIQKCELTRIACSNIDWDCEVFTKFENKNQGCRLAVSSAITWFFESVEAGIILEDDCLPSLTFFSFCRQMLNRYQNDLRVMQISGSNYLGNDYAPDGDYYFSAINDIWGWATWGRAWDKFDLSMPGYEEFKSNGGVKKYLKDRDMSNWLTMYFDDAKNPEASVWSSQWTYAIAKNNALTIAPSKNLVDNIGFDDQGTHSSSPSWQIYNGFKVEELMVRNHPKIVERNLSADRVRFSVIKKTDPRCFMRSRIRAFLYLIYTSTRNSICQAIISVNKERK
jgi:hypothetical protein